MSGDGTRKTKNKPPFQNGGAVFAVRSGLDDRFEGGEDVARGVKEAVQDVARREGVLIFIRVAADVDGRFQNACIQVFYRLIIIFN